MQKNDSKIYGRIFGKEICLIIEDKKSADILQDYFKTVQLKDGRRAIVLPEQYLHLPIRQAVEKIFSHILPSSDVSQLFDDERSL